MAVRAPPGVATVAATVAGLRGVAVPGGGDGASPPTRTKVRCAGLFAGSGKGAPFGSTSWHEIDGPEGVHAHRASVLSSALGRTAYERTKEAGTGMSTFTAIGPGEPAGSS